MRPPTTRDSAAAGAGTVATQGESEQYTARPKKEARVRRAKIAISFASESILRGEPFAAEIAQDALDELNAARRALADAGGTDA